MVQTPMISCPLKQTSEVDWIQPLKGHIRSVYGEDPERYNEECATLNRLRQDMRGAGKDSAAGRDLLYRYYGQLELLDLRFPVDENHIKISFTWFDAFTHKPTSQYSLAYEKASIIFNISAVLACHAAIQNRADVKGVKIAYHSFQASAGMFTYINENFLHAPSIDLSRETVKTLISIMLAQAQEVLVEKQIEEGKPAIMVAKLASQAAFLYSQAVEGITATNVSEVVFERVWMLVTQYKSSQLASLSQYYQAVSDAEANSHGSAIARLMKAEALARDASRVASSIPSSIAPTSNLPSDTASVLTDQVKRHISSTQEKLASFIKDNDFIYHQSIPNEAALSMVPKMAAAKAIPVTELYGGQDIHRIIGQDIFQRIVPIAVTESASLYDEEKAKLIRAEAEKVETANDEMAASLDYLKLPGSLNVLKGGLDQETTVDESFRGWCEELAGHESFGRAFEQLQSDKNAISAMLDSCSRHLDTEEASCEKMRVNYGSDWTQQPSSRLNSTLRSDIRNYRGAMEEANSSDLQLLATSRQYESDFDEMRSAGETDEADVLYQRAMIKAGGSRGKGKSVASPGGEGNLLDEDYGEGGTSIMDQIARIEDLLKKLNLIKRDRMEVLKDLKEKVHNDDISNVLILNKKSIANHESKLFEVELEKFRSYQNRLLQTIHKQHALLKELTKAYGDLLQDKRVRSEQAKYESFTRQRSAVLSRYKKVYQSFNDLIAGLLRAQSFYSELKDTVESLKKNVETFVNNRKDEGSQLLDTLVVRAKPGGADGQADRERDRLQQLMDRMTISPAPPHRSKSSASRPPAISHPSQNGSMYSLNASMYGGPPPTSPPYNMVTSAGHYSSQVAPSSTPGFSGYPPNGGHQNPTRMAHPAGYDPMQYPYQPRSPPTTQMYPPNPPYGYPQQLPPGFVPPPPPPGPPPGSQGYGHAQPSGRPTGGSPPGQGDPWAGLSAWR
ncbi:bck1-like resistance to osmotic shock [Xylographa opegraphella]|nr:bck1-like resistance to osmotic shock [Xylographa opegraphella]